MASRAEKLKIVEKRQLRSELPEFDIGDTVKMRIKVQEAGKVRQHPWEGIVIARRGRGIHETFTVRKISYGEGVERIFPIHSPDIVSMKVFAKGKVKQAKLFYLRGRTGKKARVDSTLVKQ